MSAWIEESESDLVIRCDCPGALKGVFTVHRCTQRREFIAALNEIINKKVYP